MTQRPLSADRAYRAVVRRDCGGICVFAGTVRNTHEGRRVRSIRYTAFREMTLETFRRFAAEARRRFGARSVHIAHRTGLLKLGEASVVIAVAAPHRAEAFAACRWIIERLKKLSPIWKEEFTSRGKVWVGKR